MWPTRRDKFKRIAAAIIKIDIWQADLSKYNIGRAERLKYKRHLKNGKKGSGKSTKAYLPTV